MREGCALVPAVCFGCTLPERYQVPFGTVAEAVNTKFRVEQQEIAAPDALVTGDPPPFDKPVEGVHRSSALAQSCPRRGSNSFLVLTSTRNRKNREEASTTVAVWWLSRHSVPISEQLSRKWLRHRRLAHNVVSLFRFRSHSSRTENSIVDSLSLATSDLSIGARREDSFDFYVSKDNARESRERERRRLRRIPD